MVQTSAAIPTVSSMRVLVSLARGGIQCEVNLDEKVGALASYDVDTATARFQDLGTGNADETQFGNPEIHRRTSVART